MIGFSAWSAMRTAMPALSLLLAGCASVDPAAPEPAAAPPAAPASHQVGAYVEHKAAGCEASARQKRCLDPSHWRVRVDDRAVGDQAELRACLHELAHRFPEAEEGAKFYSRVELTLRPEPDASYASVQQVIQLAVAEGIVKVLIATPPPPPPDTTRQAGAAPAESRELRIAVFWDEVQRKTRIETARGVVRDRDELRAAIAAIFTAPGEGEPVVIIDAADLVPWGEVVEIVVLTSGARLELASGKSYQDGGR